MLTGSALVRVGICLLIRCLDVYRIWTEISRCSVINIKNQKARLTFAEKHVRWAENWSEVHFSDDRKFNLFRAKGKPDP